MIHSIGPSIVSNFTVVLRLTIYIFYSCVFLTFFSGCTGDSWEKESNIYGAVWSEDGKEIAFIINEYEIYSGAFSQPGAKIRNQQYKLHITDGELNVLTEIPLDRKAADGTYYETLFYEKTQGYVITAVNGRQLIIDLEGNLLTAFSQTYSDVGVCEIRRWGDRLLLLPSADGEYIAKFGVNSDCVRTIEFLDANDGFSVINADPVLIDEDEIEYFDIAWTVNNDLALQLFSGQFTNKSWLVSLDGNLTSFDEFQFTDDCFKPPTKSWNYAKSMGRLIIVTGDGMAKVSVINEDSKNPVPGSFGCEK